MLPSSAFRFASGRRSPGANLRILFSRLSRVSFKNDPQCFWYCGLSIVLTAPSFESPLKEKLHSDGFCQFANVIRDGLIPFDLIKVHLFSHSARLIARLGSWIVLLFIVWQIY